MRQETDDTHGILIILLHGISMQMSFILWGFMLSYVAFSWRAFLYPDFIQIWYLRSSDIISPSLYKACSII